MIPGFRTSSVREAERVRVDASPTDALMKKAACGVADAVSRMKMPDDTVTTLVGGGDNGGDALYAAANLAEAGMSVRVALLSSHPHSRALAAAEQSGVDIRVLSLPLDESAMQWLLADIWVDGILGTGLTGVLRESLADVLTQLSEFAANQGIRVVAVDLPSGVMGDTGALVNPVLPAERTVTMGAAKSSLFLPPAALHAGSVQVVDLGLDEKKLASGIAFTAGQGHEHHTDLADLADMEDMADARFPFAGHIPTIEVFRPGLADLVQCLHVPGPSSHKYTRGVVMVAAGSATYPGAGVLAACAAQAAGPGMVRFVSDPLPTRLVFERQPSIVAGRGRSQSVVIGSGADEFTMPQMGQLAHDALDEAIPIVLDAGALDLVPDLCRQYGQLRSAVLTPHAGEAAALLSRMCGYEVTRETVESHCVESALHVAALTGAVVTLKGAVTLVAAPDGRVFSLQGAPAWAGTAGSGDVLAGIMGSIVAGGFASMQASSSRTACLDLAPYAATAVWVHSQAASLAATRVATAGMSAAGRVTAGVAAQATSAGAPAAETSTAAGTEINRTSAQLHSSRELRPHTADMATRIRLGGPIDAWNMIEAIPATIADLVYQREHIRRVNRRKCWESGTNN